MNWKNIILLHSISFKYIFGLLGFVFCMCSLSAQQKIEPNKMNYIYTNHPYCILYHDTLFAGSKAFKKLFYRTGDKELIQLYTLHQRNKVWGNAVVFVGTLSTVWGVLALSDRTTSSSQRTLGWITTLGGVGCDIVGGILLTNGQRYLASAAHLFNIKNTKTTVSLGIGEKRAGLVLNW